MTRTAGVPLTGRSAVQYQTKCQRTQISPDSSETSPDIKAALICGNRT